MESAWVLPPGGEVTPKPRYKDGILAEYARRVSSASDGAIVI